MKKILLGILLLLTTLSLASCKSTPSVNNESYVDTNISYEENYHDDKEDIDYHYYKAMVQFASKKKKAQLPVVYSDEIFFKDSTVYHHFLAKQSIGLALASFNLEPDYSADGEESGSLYDYLYDLGFLNVRVDDYYKETSEYTVGTAIAKKTIVKDGEEAILFVCAIRGGNYKNEWQSNLNVSPDIRHEGFNDAATLVTDRILSYITTQDEIGNFKLWITGFSRAGAIANLVAANLNKSLLFEKEDVYAYTFAAPEAVSGMVEQSEYDNIFNLMGASDFIPQFVPKEWGYAHYGVDLFLPGAEFDSKFESKYALVQEALKKQGVDTHYNVNFNLRLRLLYGILLELCPNEFQFSEEVQAVFLSILSDKSINNVVHLLRSTFMSWKQEGEGLTENKNKVIDYAINFLPHLILNDDYMEGQNNHLSSSLLGLAHEHFPELYFYTIYTVSEDELFNNSDSFAYISIDNNVNYYIKDKKTNELLYKIESGNKILTDYAINNKYNISYFKSGSKNILVLPYDLDYEVTIQAPKNTNVDVKVTEYDRVFRSMLVEHNYSKNMAKDESVVLLSVTDENATYIGENNFAKTYDYAQYLGVDKLVFHYQALIVLASLLVFLVVTLIVFLVYVLRIKTRKFKLKIPKFALISLTIISALEAELAYFLLSDYPAVTVVFKVIGMLSVIGLCFISNKDNYNIKKLHKTIMPFVVVMMIGNLVLSINIVTALFIYVFGIGYLVYYYMLQKRLTKNMWISYAISVVFTTLLMMLFIRMFNLQAILVYIIVAELLLLIFCSSLYEGIKEYVTYALIVAFVFLIMYFYMDIHFMYSILYIVLFNSSMAMIAIDKKKKKIEDNIEIDNNLVETNE